MSALNEVNLADVQGLIARGYGKLRHAYFLMLTFPDGSPEAARRWLRSLEVTRASQSNAEVTALGRGVNVALTASGLARLGLDKESLDTFPRELTEGMAAAHRQRLLGDEGALSPENWRWGGPGGSRVDAVLFLYARDENLRDQLYLRATMDSCREGIVPAADPILSELLGDGERRKEHFGFDDGISNPYIPEFDTGPARASNAVDITPLGEVLLGYPDAYEQIPESPSVPDHPSAQHLDRAAQAKRRDLGRNGSYVVFRQIAQDVREFWSYLHAQAGGVAERRRELAEKIVGRRLDGVPLVAPCRPVPEGRAYGIDPEERQSDIAYRNDPRGQACPIAAHIRRANPRDGLGTEPDDSLKMTRSHRLLRRGRPYGKPLSPDFDPDSILGSIDDKRERGLNFIAFNTNIARQFEFVQRTWVNSAKFNGLYSEPDPLVGPRDGIFTIPEGRGIRRRLTALSRFVSVRGGTYLFMPGLRALEYLSRPLEGAAGTDRRFS
jgi:Dyp-type peroxidase family